MITGIKLTERDIALLQFINTFGFCEMPHIDRRFGLRKPRNYQLLKRLIAAGFVKHERVFYGRHGIYRLSVKGARATGIGLPPLARIPLGNYRHDVMLIDVYLRLREQYPAAGWISCRELMQDKHVDGVGKFGHLPDGVLVFGDGKQVAVEVELTLKGKGRLERILKGYGAAFNYKEVWYYCSEGVLAAMGPLVEKLPFIKLFSLRELLE